MTMIFAIPSKGRLKEQAEAFLSACGLIFFASVSKQVARETRSSSDEYDV